MTLMYGSDLASGGWDAVDNIIASMGLDYFPAQQRQTVKSETVQAAGGTGQTFRPTAPENPSMVESKNWSLDNWLGSPYQEELSAGYKSAESKALAEVMGPKADPFGEGLDYMLTQTRKITTLFDQLRPMWDPREVIDETPREGAPEGKPLQHLNDVRDKGAEVFKAGIAALKGILGQVKGLFNLGFDPTGKQPVFSIEHELEPTVKIGIGVVAAAIILVLLLRK